jgi:hypothetical protein
MSAGLLRAGLLIALPILVAVIALLTGADIGTGKWLSAAHFPDRRLRLLTLAWVGYRRWRRRRRSSTQWGFRPNGVMRRSVSPRQRVTVDDERRRGNDDGTDPRSSSKSSPSEGTSLS